MNNLTTGLVSVLFVAASLLSIGIFAAVWRRNLASALTGIPLMFGGAGIAFSASRASPREPRPRCSRRMDRA